MQQKKKMETAASAVRGMRIGWNIGNTLDSCGVGHVSQTEAAVTVYETQWNNPVITKELIHVIRELGYGAVRIPVTYFEHMDERGNVDSAWLARVKEVADYVLEEGMYCITNVHHDTGAGEQAWLRADAKVFEREKERYIRLWEQIADVFRDYGEKLILESFNEMLDAQSRWDITDSEGYEYINRYNQLFVDTVRKSGGNNRTRNLLLNTYGASPMTPAARAFQLPTDVSAGGAAVSEHLMVGVHFYKPDAFSAGDMEYWNEAGEKEVDDFFERMDQYFLQKKIPVVMGECGTHDIRLEVERVKYVQAVLKRARKRAMAYFWWDDGGCMRLIDRANNQVVFEELQQALVQTPGGKTQYEGI